MNHFLSLRLSKKILYILGLMVVILAIFRAGMTVGYHQGNFSREWVSNLSYQRFSDPLSVFSPFVSRDRDPNPHGVVGTIADVQLPNILVKGPRTAEQIVIVTNDTTIRHLMSAASSSDLRSGDQIIVIGDPNGEGTIIASFIRVIPDTGSSVPNPPMRRQNPLSIPDK